MRHFRVRRLLCLVFCAAQGYCLADPASVSRLQAYGSLPLTFEANQGQAPPESAFLARAEGYTMYLSQQGADFMLSGQSTHPWRFGMHFVGAQAAHISGSRPVQTKTNYLLGPDQKRWLTNVPNFGAVSYEGLYPGIDMLFYGNQKQFEYDLIVSAHSDPAKIRFVLEGFSEIRVNADGDLILDSPNGEFIQRKPAVYEERGRLRRSLNAKYVLIGKNEIGFSIDRRHNRSRLVIDPVLVYSTFLGGAGQDFASAIAVDTAGNAYLTGVARSPNFPVLNPEQPTYGGGASDLFVAKLNAAGTALVYCTYIGGTGDDFGSAITVDNQGNVYVTGSTSSNTFPVTAGAFQTSGSAFNYTTAFVLKLNPSGSALLYSTYLGGDAGARAAGITVDSAGDAYVVGNGPR